MKTFNSEESARGYMIRTNKSRAMANNDNICVRVDGPDDGQFTVMELGEAIDNGFYYTWSA